MKRVMALLFAGCMAMGFGGRAALAETFVVGFQPYDTISYQAIINAELGLWKKNTSRRGRPSSFSPLCRGRSLRPKCGPGQIQIGYMSVMPAVTLCVRAKGEVKMVSTTDMSEGDALLPHPRTQGCARSSGQ